MVPTPGPTPAAHGLGPSPTASATTTGEAKWVRYEGSGADIGGMGLTPAPSPAARCTGPTCVTARAVPAATTDGVEGVG